MKLKKICLSSLLILGSFFLISCGKNKPQKTAASPTEIHYSAAASLKDALTEIKQSFEKEQPQVKVNLDFAGSGAIVKKVIGGAPIDGVLLASKKDRDNLTSKTKLTATPLLKNTLVLIAPKKEKLATTDLKEMLQQSKKIALGEPKSVPAGNYGKQTLEKLNLYDTLKDHFVYASDVRQVLAYVESGNANCGFVYETDAILSNKVQVVTTIPDDFHDAILYYRGFLEKSDHLKESKLFYDYLATDTAKKVFEKYGFKANQ